MNNLIVLILVFTGLYSQSFYAQKNILFVTSNQDYYGPTKISTANHFEEIVVPYDVFTKAGYKVDFISPKGGAIPIGYINASDSIQKKYLYDSWFMSKLAHTRKPDEVMANNYAAIFYSGGGAAMFGVAEDQTIQKIAREIYSKNGVISTICHGTAGIAYLKGENGVSLYAGKKITGYPDKFERKEAEYYKTFPFAIDKAITANKGSFVYSDKGGDGFYSVDGRFVTGQDPSSAPKVANEVVTLLSKNFKESNDTHTKSDSDQIREALLDYIEGTANGQPERLRKAFHPNFNLYSVANDTLWIRSGKQYIADIKVGQKSNRIGRIIAVDIEKDAAIAKAEIKVPNWRTFTDYFILLKYEGTWKIIHKSYSWLTTSKKE
ncbi:nuclear transport factor 2 family protein [Flavobacterium sp. N502536]|uniref:nuclear transport factor 2 family protein n=1 Tax=Flavobacterium sp. N502536 TaxID=2986837 RepID=UPI0022222744|nr:nuclear transport factor 2 family protein [Flavobacterium sp. N502536]